MLYAIAIIMLLAVIPISEYMAGGIQNSSNNYLLVLIFDIAVGYFCMYIAALLKFNILKQKNQALENALTEKQQENVSILLEHQNEKQQDLQQKELEWFAGKIKMFTEEEQKGGRKVNCVMRCFSFKLIGRGSASAKGVHQHSRRA